MYTFIHDIFFLKIAKIRKMLFDKNLIDIDTART